MSAATDFFPVRDSAGERLSRKWSKSRSLRPVSEFPGTDDIDWTSRNAKLRDARDSRARQARREEKEAPSREPDTGRAFISVH